MKKPLRESWGIELVATETGDARLRISTPSTIRMGHQFDVPGGYAPEFPGMENVMDWLKGELGKAVLKFHTQGAQCGCIGVGNLGRWSK